MSNTFYIILQKNIYSILLFSLVSLQEVGSIIGKKGEIVKRFREEVSYCYRGIKMIKNMLLELRKMLSTLM